jgi:uncharacterized membrane protein
MVSTLKNLFLILTTVAVIPWIAVDVAVAVYVDIAVDTIPFIRRAYAQ